MNEFYETTMGGAESSFPATRWTLILNLADSHAPQYREHLDYLIQLYWKPVYRYVRRSWGKSNEEAKDVTQSYFLGLMEDASFLNLSQDKGRFRTFLKASLKNFLLRIERDRSRIKRGGGNARLFINWDELENELPDERGESPEDAFDREWAQTLIDAALSGLKKDLEEKKKSVYFELFREFHFPEGEPPSYDQLAQKHQLTRADVGNYLKAARAGFKQSVLSLIAEYVTDETGREREFYELFGRGL